MGLKKVTITLSTKMSLALLTLSVCFSALSCELRHAAKLSNKDHRQDYPLALLSLLLEATEQQYGQCKLVESSPANQNRQISWLKEGQNIDIAWLPVTDDLNRSLLPLTFPIRKGFLGWRLLLVHQDNLDDISAVENLEDLNAFSAGFGASWGDLPVMKYNFDSVITGVSYESLFEMLYRKRFDFLSRAAYEAIDELESRRQEMPDLAIVPNIALHYREADFFYLNPNSEKLHKRLSDGFTQTMRDGSLNRLFYSFYSEIIDKVNMRDRLIIELENPGLPKNVPIDSPELWFQLDVYERLRLQAFGAPSATTSQSLN